MSETSGAIDAPIDPEWDRLMDALSDAHLESVVQELENEVLPDELAGGRNG